MISFWLRTACAFQEYNPLQDEFYGATGDSHGRFIYQPYHRGSDAAVFF